MNKYLVVIAAALVLIGCSGGESTGADAKAQTDIIEACKSSGAPEAVCNCFGKSYAENLNPELLASAAKAVTAGQSQSAWMATLSEADRVVADKANDIAEGACT